MDELLDKTLELGEYLKAERALIDDLLDIVNKYAKELGGE